MTEAEWLNCSDPRPMLAFVRSRRLGSDRQLRLYAAACCRRIWPLLTESMSRRAVEVAEAYADGESTDQELKEWNRGAGWAINWADAHDAAEAVAWASAGKREAGWVEMAAARACQAERSSQAGRAGQADLLRDIFNPFRPAAPAPRWRTRRVVALAQTIYERRAFERMGELAEALVKGRCKDADVLDHCRGPGVHVRGCWVLDQILGNVGAIPTQRTLCAR